jgi:hypothetical protein
MFHYPHNVLAVADYLEQIFVTNEVEAREGGPLSFQILSESFLYLVQQVCKPFKALLDALDIHDVRNEWRLVNFLHHGQKFGIDVLETGALDRKEMFNVGAPGKYALQVHPLALNVDPYVCYYISAVS